MTSTPEPSLNLELLRNQDEREFTAFVARYQRLVFGLGQSLGLSGADCDDLAAETFAMVYRALPNFRGDSELSTWVYRIGYRTALKVRKRYPASPEMVEADVADLTSEGPADITSARETNDAVWRAVARLDPDQAVAVELFYRRGMAVEEIAGIMEKPAGTVKTLLFRGREKLRTLLKTLEKTS